MTVLLLLAVIAAHESRLLKGFSDYVSVILLLGRTWLTFFGRTDLTRGVNMKTIGYLVLSFFLGVILLERSADAAKKLPDLGKLCKKECPAAKDLKEVMECVETKEHSRGPDSDAFKKTKCFITHEKHEDQYRKMAGIAGEEKHDEKGETK